MRIAKVSVAVKRDAWSWVLCRLRDVLKYLDSERTNRASLRDLTLYEPAVLLQKWSRLTTVSFPHP